MLKRPTKFGTTAVSALGALGVVYGDIGTSVLYAFKECLEHGIDAPHDVLGVLSLIIWSLVVLVWYKYIGNVTRASNQGEGGILSLLSLTFPNDPAKASRSSRIMIAIGLAGGDHDARGSRSFRWVVGEGERQE